MDQNDTKQEIIKCLNCKCEFNSYFLTFKMCPICGTKRHVETTKKDKTNVI